MRVRLTCAIILSAAVGARADAPRDTTVASVNGKRVAIEYGRPSLKGRTVGQLVDQLPAERIWRAGVDQVTTLSTETTLVLGGKRVPPGKYTLYVHVPEQGEWELLVNSDPGVPLSSVWKEAPPEQAQAPWPHVDGYAEIAAREVARTAMRRESNKEPVELFTITLAPAGKGALITLAWGDTRWSAELLPAP
jgi:hypothetical protein